MLLLILRYEEIAISEDPAIAGKYPHPTFHSEDVALICNEVKATIKFQLKKVVSMGVAVGNVKMTEDELYWQHPWWQSN